MSTATVSASSVLAVRCVQQQQKLMGATQVRIGATPMMGPWMQKVAKLTVQASSRQSEAVPLEQSIKEAWTTVSESGLVKNAGIVAMNVLLAMPAFAGEEKGKIFDFNLTLPIIAIEFLVLMVALDNIWFKPVASIMDKRDQDIREKLLGVRDNSGEIQKLQDEAEAIIKAARAETTAALNETKKQTAAQLEENLKESKARIEAELADALGKLEEQKEETMRGLDKQVQALSDEIISKVIPFSV
jgi:F-type H+-transporting ATPase subunit b